MVLIRRAFTSTVGKVIAVPFLLVFLVIVVISVDDVLRGGDPCKSAIYDKSAVVFDAVVICGTYGVAQSKVDHAAAVAAQWLDNDQDGVVDEPRLLAQLEAAQPTVLMTENGIGAWSGVRTLIARRGIAGSQDLGAQETNPESGERDAAPEEIHHVIMNAGWQRLWPDTFSELDADNSTLRQAWQQAETESLYSYDDPTCDSTCKVTEFVYLATAAYLGSDADLQTNELQIFDQEQLRELAPTVVEIFESNDYAYPLVTWPDGNYPHSDNIVPG